MKAFKKSTLVQKKKLPTIKAFLFFILEGQEQEDMHLFVSSVNSSCHNYSAPTSSEKKRSGVNGVAGFLNPHLFTSKQHASHLYVLYVWMCVWSLSKGLL